MVHIHIPHGLLLHIGRLHLLAPDPSSSTISTSIAACGFVIFAIAEELWTILNLEPLVGGLLGIRAK